MLILREKKKIKHYKDTPTRKKKEKRPQQRNKKKNQKPKNIHGKVVLNLFFTMFSGSLPTVQGISGLSPNGIACEVTMLHKHCFAVKVYIN